MVLLLLWPQEAVSGRHQTGNSASLADRMQTRRPVPPGRYVMLVNNSMTESERVKITFRKNVRWFSWDWNGREHEGGAYCKDFFAEGTGPEGDGIAVWHWLAPGQEAVYRVQIGT